MAKHRKPRIGTVYLILTRIIGETECIGSPAPPIWDLGCMREVPSVVIASHVQDIQAAMLFEEPVNDFPVNRDC